MGAVLVTVAGRDVLVRARLVARQPALAEVARADQLGVAGVRGELLARLARADEDAAVGLDHADLVADPVRPVRVAGGRPGRPEGRTGEGLRLGPDARVDDADDDAGTGLLRAAEALPDALLAAQVEEVDAVACRSWACAARPCSRRARPRSSAGWPPAAGSGRPRTRSGRRSSSGPPSRPPGRRPRSGSAAGSCGTGWRRPYGRRRGGRPSAGSPGCPRPRPRRPRPAWPRASRCSGRRRSVRGPTGRVPGRAGRPSRTALP